MKRLSRFILGLAILILIGGGVFLVTWDIPAPLTDVEKTLPDDRFQR
jgi:hypothetical protein